MLSIYELKAITKRKLKRKVYTYIYKYIHKYIHICLHVTYSSSSSETKSGTQCRFLKAMEKCCLLAFSPWFTQSGFCLYSFVCFWKNTEQVEGIYPRICTSRFAYRTIWWQHLRRYLPRLLCLVTGWSESR